MRKQELHIHVLNHGKTSSVAQLTSFSRNRVDSTYLEEILNKYLIELFHNFYKQ